MIKHICQDLDPEDREHVYLVEAGFIVYLDPDNLPPEGSFALKEVAAEHVIDIVKHGIDGDPSWLADHMIDRIKLIECRSLRPIKKES